LCEIFEWCVDLVAVALDADVVIGVCVVMQPGGCSGLIYQFYFEDRVLADDAVVDFDGVTVDLDKI